MAWRESNLLIPILILVSFLFSGSIRASDQGLDKGSWEELREGLKYQEEEPEPQEISTNSNPLLAPFILTALRIGGILVLSVLLIFLIIKLVEGSSKIKKPEKPSKEVDDLHEILDVHSSLDDLIKEYELAKKQCRYREAVGLLFKIIIKHLDERGILKAEIDKTNSEYINEFPEGDLKIPFSNLSLLHEIIWYGESHLEQADFLKLEPDFKSFLETAKSGK